MTPEEWATCTDPVAMLLWLGERAGWRKRQLFCAAVWAGVADLLTDRWCRAALAVLNASPDEDWWDPDAERYETFDNAITDLDSALSNRFWDLLVAGDSELADAWRDGSDVRLTTWTDADSVRAGAALVSVAAAEGWVRSLSGSGIAGVSPDYMAFRVKIDAITACPRSEETWRESQRGHADLLRELFGDPGHRAPFDPSWRTGTVVLLARQMHDLGDFGAMPILADALQDAGCGDEAILNHCRGPGPHVRGCWVVDAVLGET